MLDAALAGGLPSGATLLVTGEEGAGGAEFVLSILRATALAKVHVARFSSALRAPARVARELNQIFDDEKASTKLDVRAIDAKTLRQGPEALLAGLNKGDVLALESAQSLTVAGREAEFTTLWREIGDTAAERGICVILLHARGSLPRETEVALAEQADGVVDFTWFDGGTARRRVLTITKMRGLSTALDGEQVPVFEVGLHRGVGFSLARGKSVL